MALCRAKYRATCYRCGTPVLEGQWIDYTRGYSSRTRHAACQTEAEKAIAPWVEPLNLEEINDAIYSRAVDTWFHKDGD